MTWDKKHQEAMKALYEDWNDPRNDPHTVTLKHNDTVIAMRMYSAGGYIEMVIAQGDQRIETRLKWNEIEDLSSIVSNLNSYMTEWNS